MNRIHKAGFTMAELLITLAIIAILISIATPPLEHFLIRNKVTTQLNRLVTIIHMARESAIFRNRSIILCRSRSGSACDGDWHEGMLLFADSNGDKQPSNNEEVIFRLAALDDDDRLYWRAFQNRQYIEMRPTGFTAWQNGTFTYCPVEGLQYARGIILNAAGRIRLTQDRNNDGIHEGASGRPLRC